MIVSCSSFSHVGWSNYETKLAAHFDTQSSAIFPPLVLYVMDYLELKYTYIQSQVCNTKHIYHTLLVIKR